MKIKGRTIMLGPIIGFIAISRGKELNEGLLNKKLKYFHRYNEIGGLVFICKSNGFNFDNETVSGYAYIPTENTGKCIWEKGVFPIPAAIYKRVDLSKETYNKLILRMGDRIFNSYFFDKMGMYKYLCDSTETKGYLPETVALTSVSDAEKLLEKYKTVYLKPLFRNKSKGIVTISRAGKDMYLFREQKKSDRLYTQSETENVISALLSKDNYVAQQGIDISLCDGRRYDFRVIMQKGYNMKWDCTAMFTRFGAVNAPVSNFTTSGYAMYGFEAIKKAFHLSPREAFVLKSQIISACKIICERIDFAAGNYGDVGIDIVMDENHEIWVLEINKLHDHRFPVLATKDRQLYYEVVTKPFFYAKALAGI
jgi:hypothetical protein